MATTFEKIAEANETILTTGIERYNKSLGRKEVKQYAEVPQRVKAFRMVFPGGTIRTELLQDTGERCTFRAEVYDENGALLGSGTAFEEKSGKINTTSYIENCETSAVGRALAFVGFGIDTSIASAEELQAALAKQEEEQKQKEEANKSGKVFAPAPKKEKPKEFEAPEYDESSDYRGAANNVGVRLKLSKEEIVALLTEEQQKAFTFDASMSNDQWYAVYCALKKEEFDRTNS